MTALKIGRYEADELDIEAYHADKESISRSSIMAYDRCPRIYQALYQTKEIEKEVTKSMYLGSAFHTLILEPHLFDQRVAVKKKVDGRTSAGKAYNDAFTLSSAGKIVIDEEMMSDIEGMKAALESHLEASMLVWNGKPAYERSYIYGDDDSGLIVKSRPDILRDNCIVDLKTCQSADEYSFSQSMHKNGNHIQGAMAQDAIFVVDGREDARGLPVVNIAIETKKPYCIAIYFIAADAIEAGRVRYKSVLKRMKASFESDVYPSYETKEIGLPRWYHTADDEV
jgi:hypothetical protein